MNYLDCSKPENQTPPRAIRAALEAIQAVHRAFGAPGNYGYGTRKGEALRFLYDSTRLLSPALKAIAPEEQQSIVDAEKALRKKEEEELDL